MRRRTIKKDKPEEIRHADDREQQPVSDHVVKGKMKNSSEKADILKIVVIAFIAMVVGLILANLL